MRDNILKIMRKANWVISPQSPELATKMMYFVAFGRPLPLKEPKTLNEKILWLKLNDYNENSLITKGADKYLVREYVQEKAPEILNEIIGVWDNSDEIEWESLPNKFVLKCNHGCGYNYICEDKTKVKEKDVKKQLDKWMKKEFWRDYAEVNYKNIEKKIICEKFIETESGFLPEDYKVYCFNGKAHCVMVCKDRDSSQTKFYYYDIEGNLLPYSEDGLVALKNGENNKFEDVDTLKKIFSYAEKLSVDVPFVRVDFYAENQEIIFGELTFTPGAGLDHHRLKDVDELFGKMLKISID